MKLGLTTGWMIAPYHLDVVHKGGRGAGGRCLPKELGALIKFAKSVGRESDLLSTVKKINDRLLSSYPKQ